MGTNAADVDHFICHTLVDITDTRVSDPARALPYQQFQNLNTLIQCIGLRAQPFGIQVQRVRSCDISDWGFGTDYQDQHDVWTLSWFTEKPGYVSIETLQEDSAGLPIHTRLEETVFLSSQVLEPTDPARANVVFRAVSPQDAGPAKVDQS